MGLILLSLLITVSFDHFFQNNDYSLGGINPTLVLFKKKKNTNLISKHWTSCDSTKSGINPTVFLLTLSFDHFKIIIIVGWD